jgi:phosphonopyruvate decarboxylase
MIDPGNLYKKLIENGLDFFAGVPDSLLKDFCAYIEDFSDKNIITANEGNAIGLAAGHYLATGRPGVVYMQNSGIGNAVNPLISLMDEDVYKIPVLLIIGWRGEPGKKDEPQHKKQGKLTLPLIECMGLEYSIVDESTDIEKMWTKAEKLLQNNSPYVLLIKKGVFSPYKLRNIKPDISEMNKEKALEIVVSRLEKQSLIVSTTGKLSRELFEIRERRGETHNRDFLTVGSMGHTSQIALGVALGNPKKTVYCFDGDGSLLMHMGSLAVNASIKAANFRYIVFNNGAHDSVGGQPTVAGSVILSDIAKACGMDRSIRVQTEEELIKGMDRMEKGDIDFLEILVKKGARSDLGRPTISPVLCKKNFMESM